MGELANKSNGQVIVRSPFTVYRLPLTIYGLNEFNDFTDFPCPLGLVPDAESYNLKDVAYFSLRTLLFLLNYKKIYTTLGFERRRD